MIVERTLDRGDDVGERRQVKDPLGIAEMGSDAVEIRHVGPDEPQTSIVSVVSEILRTPRAEVVQHGHVVAIAQETIDEVASDEPRAARDDRLHVAARTLTFSNLGHEPLRTTSHIACM